MVRSGRSRDGATSWTARQLEAFAGGLWYFLVPPRPAAVLGLALAQNRQRSLWLDVRARHQNRVAQRERGDVGAGEGGAGGGGHQEMIRVAGDRRRLAIGHAEAEHASLSRP